MAEAERNEPVVGLDESIRRAVDKLCADIKESPEVKGAIQRHLDGINFAKPIKAACEELVLAMATKHVKGLDNVEALAAKGMRDAKAGVGDKPLAGRR